MTAGSKFTLISLNFLGFIYLKRCTFSNILIECKKITSINRKEILHYIADMQTCGVSQNIYHILSGSGCGKN